MSKSVSGRVKAGIVLGALPLIVSCYADLHTTAGVEHSLRLSLEGVELQGARLLVFAESEAQMADAESYLDPPWSFVSQRLEQLPHPAIWVEDLGTSDEFRVTLGLLPLNQMYHVFAYIVAPSFGGDYVAARATTVVSGSPVAPRSVGGSAAGVSLSMEPVVELAVGGRGPGGGLIFFVDTNDDYEWTYLEFAPVEWNGGGSDPVAQWGSSANMIGATDLTIGAGPANTAMIVAALEGVETGRAAQIAAGPDFGGTNTFRGYTDWFLPSRNELNRIWQDVVSEDSDLGPVNSGAGDFSNAHYWSSSEDDVALAEDIRFTGAAVFAKEKTTEHHVRPIRAF